MSRYLFLVLAAVVLSVGCKDTSCSIDEKATINIITQVMDDQEDSWNAGDLEGFMSAYWKSDSLSFIGSSGLAKGWETTLNNYKKGYSTPEELGKLEFENLEMEQLADDAAYVVGKWTVFRTNEIISGHYTLLWKKLNGQWVIVSDHSS